MILKKLCGSLRGNLLYAGKFFWIKPLNILLKQLLDTQGTNEHVALFHAQLDKFICVNAQLLEKPGVALAMVVQQAAQLRLLAVGLIQQIDLGQLKSHSR